MHISIGIGAINLTVSKLTFPLREPFCWGRGAPSGSSDEEFGITVESRTEFHSDSTPQNRIIPSNGSDALLNQDATDKSCLSGWNVNSLVELSSDGALIALLLESSLANFWLSVRT